MAPLHHHFEQKGWKEPTIVIRFWIIAFVLALIGLSTLKLQVEVDVSGADIRRQEASRVFGLARSGTACAEALRLGGAEVLRLGRFRARRSPRRARTGLPIGDLRSVDFATLDSLVLSPGVPLTHPEPHWTVEKARAAGIEIIGDTEVFQREIAGTGAKLVAITGTNGKSTTTALTGHLFTAAGRDCEIGGNIGKAVFLLQAAGARTASMWLNCRRFRST